MSTLTASIARRYTGSTNVVRVPWPAFHDADRIYVVAPLHKHFEGTSAFGLV